MASPRANHGAPSLSKSALMLSPCIAWAGPQAPWYEEDKVDNTKRDLGIVFHSSIDESIKDDVCYDHMSPEVGVLVRHTWKYLQNDLLPRCSQVLSEAAIAIHWDSGEVRLLGNVTNRKYPDLGKGWFYGTADLVLVLVDGRLLIADWKTGGTDGAEEQLLSLACGLRKIFTHQDGGYRSVKISCLQVNEYGVWPKERDVSQTELSNHWDAMQFSTEDIGKSYEPRPGVHCTALYCPHLAYCSAITEATREMAQGSHAEGKPPMEVHMVPGAKLTDKPQTDQEAGMMMALVSASTRQTKYLKEAAKAYIKQGGRVILGQYEWSDGNDGCRWRKRHESN